MVYAQNSKNIFASALYVPFSQTLLIQHLKRTYFLYLYVLWFAYTHVQGFHYLPDGSVFLQQPVGDVGQVHGLILELLRRHF